MHFKLLKDNSKTTQNKKKDIYPEFK